MDVVRSSESRCPSTLDLVGDVERAVLRVLERNMACPTDVETEHDRLAGGLTIERQLEQRSSITARAGRKESIDPTDRAAEPCSSDRTTRVLASTACAHRRDGGFGRIASRSLGERNTRQHA